MPGYLLCQTHYLDTNVLYMSGSNVNSDIAINTFYNSIDTCNISWGIISDSLPTNWEFSICFPDCHNIGVINGSDQFLPNEKSYLNCHMYPNGTFGEGVVKMEIVTNNIYRDTLIWYGQVNLSSNVENSNSKDQYKLIKITNILGQEIPYRKNTPIFYIYDDGTVEKKIIIE